MHVPALILLFLLWSLPQGWKDASRKAEEHRSTWSGVFTSLDADPALCEALVFPETVRYHRLVDAAQQAALGLRYVQGGEEACNYSIGLFQMKPSFAREVEAAWMDAGLAPQYGLYFDLREDAPRRRERMDRLLNPHWQCVYAALFVRLLFAREPALTELWTTNPEACLRHLATAYNYRFTATFAEREAQGVRKTFHLDLWPGRRTRYYNYADLVLRHWRELGGEKR